MHQTFNAADIIFFSVTGRGTQRLLGQAVQAGLKLEHIAPQSGGFSAAVSGTGWAKLCCLAAAGGWQITRTRRKGPGPLLERLLHRPGIPAGIFLFFILTHWLEGFLWCINTDLLTVPQQEILRPVLAEYGIQEGVSPTQAQLAQAQQALAASGSFGWVSLNFTGGCLFVEGTPRQQAQPEPAAQNTGLYARAGGRILSVDITSGFAQVQPGQYIGSGMLLAAAEKTARSGASVPQAASGSVIAQVRLAYTGQQPLVQQLPALTGARTEKRTLTLLNHRWQLAGSCSAPESDAAAPQQRWIPLRIGQLALPASIQESTCWLRQVQQQTFSPQAAAALARRNAKLQLLQDYPDAVIESARDSVTITSTTAVCRTLFVFCADIAEPRSVPESSE